MQRVFQLANWLNLAGTPTVFMNWYRNIDHSKLQFDFCVDGQYTTPLVDEIYKKKGQIFIIPQQPVGWKKLKYYWQLYKVLKSNGPYDVFQTHNFWWAGLDCLVAKMAGIKKRFTISHYSQGARVLDYKIKLCMPLIRLLIQYFSTGRLAVSQEAGEFLYGKHMSFKIVHNGVDLRKFAYNPNMRSQKRAQLKLEDKFIVGHVGRFEKQKNYIFLIEIFTEIYKLNPQAHLVLVGTGKLEDQIKRKITKLGLSHAVSFMGSRIDVQAFYQAFDVFVLPSLYEGFPCVAVEAQCAGLPCFLADTIAKGTAICNTLFLSLNQSATEWADIIMKTAKDFIRKDESVAIRSAGFDMVDVGKFIQSEYLA